MLPIKFQDNWHFVSGESKGFQDGRHLGFPIRTILAIFYLQVTFLPNFVSIGLSVQEKKLKIDFKHGGHLGTPSEQF